MSNEDINIGNAGSYKEAFEKAKLAAQYLRLPLLDKVNNKNIRKVKNFKKSPENEICLTRMDPRYPPKVLVGLGFFSAVVGVMVLFAPLWVDMEWFSQNHLALLFFLCFPTLCIGFGFICYRGGTVIDIRQRVVRQWGRANGGLFGAILPVREVRVDKFKVIVLFREWFADPEE